MEKLIHVLVPNTALQRVISEKKPVFFSENMTTLVETSFVRKRKKASVSSFIFLAKNDESPYDFFVGIVVFVWN